MYNLKHFPGLVLPALPALYLAEALEIGDTSKDSTLILGLNTFCLANPGSTTYTIPSINDFFITIMIHLLFLFKINYQLLKKFQQYLLLRHIFCLLVLSYWVLVENQKFFVIKLEVR